MSVDDGSADARRGRLLALVSTVAEAKPDGGRSQLGRVCALSVSEVGVSGAGVTVMARLAGGLDGRRDQVWATDAVARRLEILQLTAGEGPCLDAYAAGAPVLVADLSRDAARWLGFAPDAVATGRRRCSRCRCRLARCAWARWTCTALRWAY